MPKNTPLPIQWLTVDGQNVPIVLPDHWDDDKKEWKTTGTGNPLPVANYTQNASGVWLPTSESNPVPTQLTGSIVSELLTETVEIPADTSIVLSKTKLKSSNIKIGLRWEEPTTYLISARLTPFTDEILGDVGSVVTLKNQEKAVDRDHFSYQAPWLGFILMVKNTSDSLKTLRFMEIIYEL